MSLTNTFQLIGNIGNIPTITETQNSRYCRISIATKHFYKNKDGEGVKTTTWHSLLFWGSSAKYVHDNFKKGQLVTVDGRIDYILKEVGEEKFNTVNLIPNQIISLTAPKTETNA